MKDRDKFKLNLDYFMKKAMKKQIDIAAALNVSKGTVSCWINGKAFPRIDVIQSIADFLECTTDDLLIRDPTISTTYSSSELSNFTEEEADLIRRYRHLSPDGKRHVLDQLEFAEIKYGEKYSDLQKEAN